MQCNQRYDLRTVTKIGTTYSDSIATMRGGNKGNKLRGSGGNMQNMTSAKATTQLAVPGELHLFSSSQLLKTQLQDKITNLRKNDLILDSLHGKNFNSRKDMQWL